MQPNKEREGVVKVARGAPLATVREERRANMNEAMMSKGKADLMELYGDLSWARYDAMLRRVKLDLALRGLTSADLGGLEIEDDWAEDEVLSWTVRVELKGDRAPLVYTLDNRDGARVHHDGAALPDVVVQ